MRCAKVGMAILMVLAGGGYSTLRAQQTAEENTRTVMEEVVVTASREKEAVARVPAHVTVIKSEEIANSTARNVPEVLAAAGLHISDIGGNQRAYTVDLRGFGEVAPVNLLVLVDGRRINQPDLSATDWTLIPLERIERIEVVPGARGSVLYGDNATGGVINIITKEGQGLEAGVSAAYGSYKTFKTSAGVNGSSGIFSYDLLGSFLQSDGYRDNSDTRAKDIGANLRVDPSATVNLNFSAGYHQDDTSLPGAILQRQLDAGASRRATFHPDDFADTEDYYIKSGLELFFLTQDAFKLDFSYRNRAVDQFATFADGWFSGDTSIETIAVSPQFVFQENFGEVSNRIVFGADFSQTTEDITNTAFSNSFGLSADSDELKRRNQGYFVHDDLGVSRNLTLSGGYRYDRARFTFGGTADHSALDEEAVTAGITYSVGPGKVYFNYGKSYRYPLLDELFSFFDNSVNAALQPQNSTSVEAGTQFELLKDLLFVFNMFHIDTQGEIFYNPTGGPFGYGANENMDGDTQRNGFETRLNYHRRGWSAGAGYTFTDSQIEGGQYTGREIPNVPRHRATANAGYSFTNGLFVGLSGVYVGSRYLIGDFNNLHVKQEEYFLLNAKVSYNWRWATFFVDLNNILNQEYASYGGLNFLGEQGYYPSPEFNLLAGVTLRYARK